MEGEEGVYHGEAASRGAVDADPVVGLLESVAEVGVGVG